VYQNPSIATNEQVEAWKNIEKQYTAKEEIIRQKLHLKNECESKS